jgi:amino acid adenylation domain-containing protein
VSSDTLSRAPTAPGLAPPESALSPFPPNAIERSIASRFEEVAREHPGRAALSEPGGVWTYAALNAAANRVGRALLGGADASRPVALLVATGAPLFAGMLGTLKAGRFYAPLDSSLGAPRLLAIWRELEAGVLLTDEAQLGQAQDLAAGRVPVLRVDETAAQGPGEDLGLALSPEALAYVLFTSGSTGAPKGVMQSHRSVLDNVRKLTNGLRIGPDDRLTLLSSPSFGASVSDIYGALLNGACLCPISLRGDGLRRLPASLEREEVTIYHSVPSVFRAFASNLDGREDLSRLRILKLGGEPVLAQDFELYRRRFPRTTVFHVGMGTTEMNVVRQWFADHDTRWPVSPPLGYGVDGAEVVLLDETGRETAEAGEIAVIASTLPVGYWRDPARTAEAFPEAPGRPGARIFRTGDLGRMLPDGCLLYLGRKDMRVKVRGHRVETSEVEAALAAVAGIREAAVVGREGASGTRLVAYVVSATVPAPGIAALRRDLVRRVPEYMVPASFVFMGELPRTASGKVDREALPPANSARPALEAPFVTPRDDREDAVARVFAEVLELECVGANDDFFDLGGSSLSAVEALARLSDLLKADLSAADLLEAPTPSALSLRARWKASSPAGGPVRLQGGHQPPVFVIPGGTGDGADLLLAARLARRVGAGFPFLGLLSGPAPHPPLERLTSRLLEQIREVEPRGPYFLVGECVGGILALAAARRLHAEGRPPALLALLDTPCPTPGSRLRRAAARLRKLWAGDLLGRLRGHFKFLRSVDPSLRRAYAVEKARVAARALGRAGRVERRRALDRQASYADRLRVSRPAPFDGSIRLIQSQEGERKGYGEAWARIAPRVEVVTVPGDHSSYLREHVDQAAGVLRQWLEQAAGSADSGSGTQKRAASAVRPVSPVCD